MSCAAQKEGAENPKIERVGVVIIFVMQRIIVFLVMAILAIGCQEKMNLDVTESEHKFDHSPKEYFAQVLSKAVMDNENLREFIKAEALKQFDKDYDVFYPFVKDQVVEDGRTFRQILLNYISENDLNSIENQLPMLNILVPDWEWIDAFSIKTWNISDTDIVVSVDGKSGHPIYYNGVLLGELENGIFPEYPVLIVKENERMKLVSPETKVSAYSYEFANDAFNPAIMTKVTPSSSYKYFETNPGVNALSKTELRSLAPEAVQAWNEYGDDPYEAQRQYVYFNMRKGESAGTLNPKIRESVLAIRLHSTNCIDDTTNDPTLEEAMKKKEDYDADSTLINDLWGEGQLEIQLYATTLDANDNIVVLNENAIPVKGSEIFDIDKAKRDFYHKTWFTKRKYVYIATKNDLSPKWYFLPTPLEFDKWDPSSGSSVIDIHAYELDGTVEKEVTDTLTIQDGISLGAKVGDKFELDFDYNGSSLERTMKYKIKTGSDDLGSKELYFDDYIIKDEDDEQYILDYYSTAKLDFIMVPLK